MKENKLNDSQQTVFNSVIKLLDEELHDEMDIITNNAFYKNKITVLKGQAGCSLPGSTINIKVESQWENKKEAGKILNIKNHILEKCTQYKLIDFKNNMYDINSINHDVLLYLQNNSKRSMMLYNDVDYTSKYLKLSYWLGFNSDVESLRIVTIIRKYKQFFEPKLINDKLFNKENKAKTVLLIQKQILDNFCIDTPSSYLSVNFWEFYGYSKEESIIKAKEAQKGRQCTTPQFWLNRGFTEEEAKEKIHKMQIDITKLKNYKCSINTDSGYEKVSNTYIKNKECVELHFDNYSIIKVACTHLFELITGEWKFANDLTEYDDVITETGSCRLVNKFNIGTQKVYDLTVDTDKHQYYLDGISSHNTGKTFLIGELLKHFVNKMNLEVVVTAPTHKAVSVVKKAINELVPCSTIHSFLNLKMKLNYNTGKEDLIPDLSKDPKKTDILIVDEASMISTELMTYIEESIKQGNIKFVIFVGDKYQLEPVGETHSIAFDISKQYELLEIVRQAKGSPIIQLATIIRKFIQEDKFPSKKQLTNYLLGLDNDILVTDTQNTFLGHYFDKKHTKVDKYVCGFKNVTVQAYNTLCRNVIKGVNAKEYEALDEVVFQSAHNYKDDVIHYNNEIVTIKETRERYNPEYNINYIECIDVDNGSPRVFNLITEDSKEDWNIYLKDLSDKAKSATINLERRLYWKTFFEAKSFIQDVKFTYSGTVHKSQGSDFEYVYVDVREILDSLQYNKPSFVFRLLYVAITRASNKLILFV